MSVIFLSTDTGDTAVLYISTAISDRTRFFQPSNVLIMITYNLTVNIGSWMQTKHYCAQRCLTRRKKLRILADENYSPCVALAVGDSLSTGVSCIIVVPSDCVLFFSKLLPLNSSHRGSALVPTNKFSWSRKYEMAA